MQVQKELREVEQRAAQIGAATEDVMNEYQTIKTVNGPHSSLLLLRSLWNSVCR